MQKLLQIQRAIFPQNDCKAAFIPRQSPSKVGLYRKRPRGCKASIAFVLMLSHLLAPLSAKELIMGASDSIPPYVIEESNSGLELDILKQALAVKGHSADIQYLPFARTYHEMKIGKLDGILNIKEGILEQVYYSAPVISFQNCAISLEKNQFQITHIKDLTPKKVVAFQRASSILGDEFNQMAQANSSYQEKANQLQQVYMLFKGHADIVVMDSNIFKYYLKKAYLEGTLSHAEIHQQAVCHKIFAPTEYRFAFAEAQIRDDFNLGLSTITANGTLATLHKQYQNVMLESNEGHITLLKEITPPAP